MSGRVLILRQKRMVDYSRDAPDRYPIAEGDKSADIVFLDERRLLPVEGPVHLVAQERHVMLAAGIGPMRHFDESVEVGAALSLTDFCPGHAGQLASSKSDRPSPISSRASTIAWIVLSICASVCSEVKKKRKRAERSGTAGGMIGCTLIPLSNNFCPSATAIKELCVTTGTTARAALVPISRSAARARSVKCSLLR